MSPYKLGLIISSMAIERYLLMWPCTLAYGSTAAGVWSELIMHICFWTVPA